MLVLVEEFIHGQGFYIVHQPPGLETRRTHAKIIKLNLFTDLLKTPVVGMPIVTHDKNQHAANENRRLQNLRDGIEIFAGILTWAERNWNATTKK